MTNLDALRQEQDRLVAVIRAASDATLASAPAILPRVRDRDIAAHLGSPRGAICYVFETDEGLTFARERGLTNWLEARTRRELEQRDYPADGMLQFRVWYATHEQIQREAGGSYYHFFR